MKDNKQATLMLNSYSKRLNSWLSKLGKTIITKLEYSWLPSFREQRERIDERCYRRSDWSAQNVDFFL